jgi:hypothetical protein
MKIETKKVVLKGASTQTPKKVVVKTNVHAGMPRIHSPW